MSTPFKTDAGARAIEARYREALQHWPVASEQLRVATREGETFVVACGPADAPPVLLLHGSGANAAMWMNDVAVWSSTFRVYAVDIIGEPGLSAPSRPALGTDAYACWLDDVMNALSVTRAWVVGVSLGGWLALDFATRRPERVSGIVLLCPSGVGRQRMSFLLRSLPLLALGRRGRRRLMRMLMGRTALRPTAADVHVGALVGLISRHFRRRRGRLPIFSDETLGRLTMPVMLIVGGRDVMLDSYQTKQRIERLGPHVTVRFLPEAGHVLREQAGPIDGFLRLHTSTPRNGDDLVTGDILG